MAPKGFLTVIRKLTKKYGTLLILDDVGTGFSRCGELYGMNIEGVVPDIATFAKGFSNGAAAIGAMVTTREIADKTWQVTNLQSTFGWTPVACAVAKKNLEIHLRDMVWKKSKQDGDYFRKKLREALFDLDCVGDVRGWGLEVGLSFVKDKKSLEANEKVALQVVAKAKEKGLFMLYGDDGNIQLMPPLTIERNDMDKGFDILIEVVQSLKK